MSGKRNGKVTIPADRTLKQPKFAFCRNPQCREVSDKEFTFRVDHDNFACPKCGADRDPMIGLLVITHLLIPKPDGPVKGSGGRRFAIACDLRRAYLATATNEEAVTDNARLINCPGCQAAVEKLNINPNARFGREMVLTDNNANPKQ